MVQATEAALVLTTREQGLLAAALERYSIGPGKRDDGFSFVEIDAVLEKLHQLAAPMPPPVLYEVYTTSFSGHDARKLNQPPMTLEAARRFVDYYRGQAAGKGITVYYDIRPLYAV